MVIIDRIADGLSILAGYAIAFLTTDRQIS